jgi:hypothetical protein
LPPLPSPTTGLQITKQDPFNSKEWFAKTMLAINQTYFIEAQPGTDLAFLSALLMAVDVLVTQRKRRERE